MHTTSVQHRWLVGNLVCRFQFRAFWKAAIPLRNFPNYIALLKPCLAFDTHFFCPGIAPGAGMHRTHLRPAKSPRLSLIISYCITRPNHLYLWSISCLIFCHKATSASLPGPKNGWMSSWANMLQNVHQIESICNVFDGTCKGHIFALFLWLPTLTVLRSRHTIWAPRLPKDDPQLLPGMGIEMQPVLFDALSPNQPARGRNTVVNIFRTTAQAGQCLTWIYWTISSSVLQIQ